MTKAELRKIYLEKRLSLSAKEAAWMSKQISERFFAEIGLEGIGTIHTFIRIAKFNEVDTSMIYSRIWREMPEIRTFAPRLGSKTGEIECILFDHESEFEENAWGIREPAGNKKADPEEIDLVIVPLLCFDERGYRVGYGKGFYDRFLKRCRPDCRRIGLSYFPAIDLIDDVHEGDVAIDICITPDTVARFE